MRRQDLDDRNEKGSCASSSLCASVTDSRSQVGEIPVPSREINVGLQEEASEKDLAEARQSSTGLPPGASQIDHVLLFEHGVDRNVPASKTAVRS